METLPANVTAEADVYGRPSLHLVQSRPGIEIGSFKFGLPAVFAKEEAWPAERDQVELEEACKSEDLNDGNTSDASPGTTAPPPALHDSAGPEGPRVNPIVANLRSGATEKARHVHATLSFRQKLADEAFQMGAGGTTEKSFLQTLVEKLAAAGLKPPTVTVEYMKVNVEADALVGSANIPSLSNVAAAALKVGPHNLICTSSCPCSTSIAAGSFCCYSETKTLQIFNIPLHSACLRYLKVVSHE